MIRKSFVIVLLITISIIKNITTTSLYRSCKEILTANPSSQSGIYQIASVTGSMQVYCEMVLRGGGYTFIDHNSFKDVFPVLNSIFTDKSQVLFRIQSQKEKYYQPYILTKQLWEFSNSSISIMYNSNTAYSTPLNTIIGNYMFVGFVPRKVF